MAKPKLWLGLSTVGILVTSVLLAGRQLAGDYAGLINDALGLSTQKIGNIDSAEVEGSAYKDENGSLSNKGWYHMIADSYQFCEEAVEQGSALLKNELVNGKPALPLEKTERRVTLLGRGSKNLFMRSGAGGAAPNPNLVVTLDKAFENNGFKVNKQVYKAYKKLSQREMTTPNTNVESFSEINTDELKGTFADYGDAAIITFVRIGTENSDPQAKQLDLKDDEKKLLQMVKEYKDDGTFKKVIVLINSPLPMSMDWVDKEEYGVDALLYVGVPGYYGAGGIAHILAGEKPHVTYDEIQQKMVPSLNADGSTIMEVVNPSGHLPDTFAANSSSSAAYQNFGNSSVVVYKEGVYVGYKYYETRYEDQVLNQGNATGTAGVYNSASSWDYAEEMGYPFGFGLSYTQFDQKITDLKYNESDDTVEAKVVVKNTGSMNGKASIQLYVQQPYTDFDKANAAYGIGKPSIALMAYDKVDVPAGREVEKTIKFDRYFLATYDFVEKKTYFLQEGDYYFAVGNGAHEALNNIISVKNPGTNLFDHLGKEYAGKANAVDKLHFNEEPTKYSVSHYDESVHVTNQFDDADYNYFATGTNKIKYLDRSNWEGTWPTATTSNPAPNADRDMSNYYKASDIKTVYDETDTTQNGVLYNAPYKNADGVEVKITFHDMAKIPLEGEITDEEAKAKFPGMTGDQVWEAFIRQMSLDDLIISVSDNRGILDVKKIEKKGNSVAEGPEGLLSRYQYGKKLWATGFPTGPVYTGTFDPEMQSKFGQFYGEDALFCGVACVNAPGANINRTPYGSRASEYMSEDGIMNYNVAANIVSAARKKGLIMNIKHCFLNNQETGRQKVATFCNEQAIREIYLRPFEGALTKGNGLGIMTSYNRIGVRYAACHEPLMKNVMRDEWKYKGLIIDDALPGSNTDNYSNGPAMLHAGTDLFCLDGKRGGDLKTWIKSNSDGDLLQDLQRANKYVLYAISRSWMGGVAPENVGAAPWWKVTVDVITISAGTVTVALFGMYIFTEIMSKKKAAKPVEAAE